MPNIGIEALLIAFRNSRDDRLLDSALDLSVCDLDRRMIVDVVLEFGVAGLQYGIHRKLVQASLDMGDANTAVHLCADDLQLLSLQVEAMIAAGKLSEAEAYYLSSTASNPIYEDTDIGAMIDNAKANSRPEMGTNIIGFASAARGLKSSMQPDDYEQKTARMEFGERNSQLRFADVGGLEDVKRQITRRIVTPFKKPSLFAKYRRKAGGGVLLFGPPGCGKTLLARATAGECEARFVNVPVVDVVDKYIGEAEHKLAAIFSDARRDTPTVLFFDELEALAGSRSSHNNQSQTSLVSTFLAEMDGFTHNNEGVLILAATNMPWGVDTAFRRPGRFDRVQFVPPPDKAAREEILKMQLTGRPVEDDIDISAIAKKTSGFSGADLENLITTAVDIAIECSLASDSEHPVSSRHLAEALSEVRPTTLEWLTTARNYSKYSNTGGQYDDVAEFIKNNSL